MKPQDFKDMSMGFFEYDEKVTLWGMAVSLTVFVEKKLLYAEYERLNQLYLDEQQHRLETGEITDEEYDEAVENYEDADGLPEITIEAAQKLIEFAESSRGEVIRSMLDLHMDELAEQWLYESTVDEDVQVTAEQFIDSLIPLDIIIEFKEMIDEGSGIYFEFGCEPDWFAGHRIHVRLNAEGKAVCEGI